MQTKDKTTTTQTPAGTTTTTDKPATEETTTVKKPVEGTPINPENPKLNVPEGGGKAV